MEPPNLEIELFLYPRLFLAGFRKMTDISRSGVHNRNIGLEIPQGLVIDDCFFVRIDRIPIRGRPAQILRAARTVRGCSRVPMWWTRQERQRARERSRSAKAGSA